MSAPEALKQSRTVGIRVGVDGYHLALEASPPPLPEVPDLLALHTAYTS